MNDKEWRGGFPPFLNPTDPQVVGKNPVYTMISKAPNEEGPGMIFMDMPIPIFPNQPPVRIRFIFDRNHAEQLSSNLRKAMDDMKGIKQTGGPNP